MPTTCLESRALRAYARAFHGRGSLNQPSAPEVIAHEHVRYVVLSNVNGTLAVYRVTSLGRLRALREWPAAVAPDAPRAAGRA